MDDPTVAAIARRLAPLPATNEEAAADAFAAVSVCDIEIQGGGAAAWQAPADVLDAVWTACERVMPGIRRASVGAGGDAACIFDLGVDSLACAEVVTALQVGSTTGTSPFLVHAGW